MKLDSARELKQMLSAQFLAEDTGPVHSSVLRLQPARSRAAAEKPRVRRSLALGLAPKGKEEFRLAVRIQRAGMEDSHELRSIRKKAKGEVDIQYIGRIQKLTTPWYQSRQRPLRVGLSIGHYLITAGTLGCFVRSATGGNVMVLSNNHVLANENAAKKGDAVIQAGDADGGKNPADLVAVLSQFVRLKKTSINSVDAAAAEVTEGIPIDLTKVTGLGKLAGVGPQFLAVDTAVAKIGRTTGLTRGRVTAFELDNVVVAYDIGDLRFDNQIEVEGAGQGPFSQGGDSGSVIVDEDRQAVGLLFAGGDAGGSNGKGLTYVNPIHGVLAAMKIQLAL